MQGDPGEQIRSRSSYSEDKSLGVRKTGFMNAIAPTGKQTFRKKSATLYQFDAYEKYEPRGCGGVFHLVWFNSRHKMYPGK
jgi:hypothetical protein